MSKKKKKSNKVNDRHLEKKESKTPAKLKKKQSPKVQSTQEKLEAYGIQNSFWVNHQMHIMIVFFLSCALYANTIGHKYAVDDSIVILRNQFTKKGFAGMKGIWGEDTFTGFFGKKRNLVAGGRYRPLSVATFAVELQLFGTVIKDQKSGEPILDADGDINYQGSPMVSHLFNILLYAWLCVIIYLVLLQMFNPTRDQNNLKGYFIALAGALLYACHPIHTEAVANIKGRDEIMVLLGSVLALYWVLKAAANPEKAIQYHVGAVIAFILAIFSKENAVTFLAIIPAALYFFTRMDIPKIAMQTAPYLAVIIVFWFGIRGPILGDAGAVISSGNAPAPELMNDPFLKWVGNGYTPFTTSEWLATVLYSWLEYIKLLIFPHPLTNDYYPSHIRTDANIIPTFQMGRVLLSVLVHGALGVLLLIGTLRKKPYAFFLLFYFATFSVVSNLIFPIGSNMAERFMFLPSVGFSALCAMGLYELISRGLKKNRSLEEAIKGPVVLLIIICSLYSLKTVIRNPAWYDDYTLFTVDIENSPHSAKLNNAVSGVLQDRANRTGNRDDRKKIVEQALFHSLTATKLHPTYNNAWLLRGNANVMLGNICEGEGADMQDPNARNTRYTNALNYYNSGIKAYEEVIRLRPNHPDVKRNSAVVYRDKGKLLGQRLNRLDESIAAIEKSLTYSEKDFESFRLLGVAYGIKGMDLERRGNAAASFQSHKTAISYFEKGYEMNPYSAPILYNLEVAYRMLGMIEKAEECNKKWKEIDPSYDPKNQQ